MPFSLRSERADLEAMPRFFMNMRDGRRYVPDEEGDELADEGDLREHALATARDMILYARSDAVRDWLDWRFEITDEAGETVLVLPFEEAVQGL